MVATEEIDPFKNIVMIIKKGCEERLMLRSGIIHMIRAMSRTGNSVYLEGIKTKYIQEYSTQIHSVASYVIN